MTINTPDSLETPAQTLAQRIIERLVEQELISAKDGVKLQPKLAGGKLRAVDWRLAIELAGKKEATQ